MAIPQTFDEAFTRVKELVSIFTDNESKYLAPGYSEAQARLDFIDKFWIALGWDVNHEAQTDPYKQEVKVERGVATSEFRKRADYAFLAPNFRDVRFFVEAKKPHAYYIRTKRNRTEGIKAGCIQRPDGTLQLSLLQKRQILLNNIYGVDIETQ